MTHALQYRGYYATLEIDLDAKMIVGRVANVRAALLFEGETPSEAERDFHATIDDYLDDCKARGIRPEESFSGTLQVRLDSRADHQALATLAVRKGSTINAEVKLAVKAHLLQSARVASTSAPGLRKPFLKLVDKSYVLTHEVVQDSA